MAKKIEILEPGKAIPANRGYAGIGDPGDELFFPAVDSCCAVAAILEDGTLIGGHLGAQWPGDKDKNYEQNSNRIFNLMDANRKRLGGKKVKTVITVYMFSDNTWEDSVYSSWSLWEPENAVRIDLGNAGTCNVTVTANSIVVTRKKDSYEKTYQMPSGFAPTQVFS